MRLEAQSSHKKYPKNGCRELANITPHLEGIRLTPETRRDSLPDSHLTPGGPRPSPGLRKPAQGSPLQGHAPHLWDLLFQVCLCLRSLTAPPDDPNLVEVWGKDRNRLLGTCLGVGKTRGANPTLSPPPGRGCAAPNSSRITGRKDGRTQGSLQDPTQRHPLLCNPSQDPQVLQSQEAGVETGRYQEPILGEVCLTKSMTPVLSGPHSPKASQEPCLESFWCRAWPSPDLGSWRSQLGTSTFFAEISDLTLKCHQPPLPKTLQEPF